jgi:single-strand DNA-binding protein
MKTITIAGNVGKDAEVRQTQGGQSVTDFTVAVEERNGSEKGTVWFDVSLWGSRGEKLAQYITKGSKIVAIGELKLREHNGKTYPSVNASDVTLMGGKREEGSGYTPGPRQARAEYPAAGGGPMGDIDDAIPFNLEWRG